MVQNKRERGGEGGSEMSSKGFYGDGIVRVNLLNYFERERERWMCLWGWILLVYLKKL